MRLPLLLLAAASLSASLFAAPTYPPLDAKATAAMDRSWRRIERRTPDSGAREVYTFLLTAVAHNWKPEHWAEIIRLGEELHDRDQSSPTYGNYRWYWREPKPNDRNAVEFSMQCASLTWAAYRDRLPADVRSQLAAALTLGAEGMLRHKVDVSYTNIFLMRVANCLLIGEALDRPDLVARGRERFDQWLAYTRRNGIHEFSSPTYYGTDLTDLGALMNFSRSPDVRKQAQAALRLLWTDIAANWFAPYEGIAGAHSRDYGFLTGHGYLDQQLLRAGWLDRVTLSESHDAIDDLTFWRPPGALLASYADKSPRVVTQRWGAESWEIATHYVGRHISLGSAGAGYGAQDKVLALTFAGGPKMPIVAFSLDYRRDPYGQSKMGTADGHSKLTHLMPFIASVQRGPEVLLAAYLDPAHTRNPAGGKAPIEYQGVDASFVLPLAALAAETQTLPVGSRIKIPERSTVGLRYGGGAAALTFLEAENDEGKPAETEIVRDGEKLGAARLTANLAKQAPRRPVLAIVWVRAADNITDDASYDAFLDRAHKDAMRAQVVRKGQVEVTAPGLSSTLRLELDPSHARRITVEGGEPGAAAGILTVNGQDVGGPLLAK